MASTTNRVRSSVGGQGHALHLGSFSRLEIADFDSKGRYPTTPSPNETKVTPATYSFSATAPYQQEDRAGENDINGIISGQPNGPDPVVNYDSPRASPQDNDRQDLRASRDSESPQNPAPGTPIQDPARASLPPGPRHPQAPSRASMISQSPQTGPAPPLQQQTMRTGSMAPAAYPYSPAPTPTQLPNSSNNNQPQPQKFIPTTLNYGPTMPPVQNIPGPQQPAQPEEVCIECMMRDRDMADVIVVGPGIWERESDVHLRDLHEREDEEERLWRDRHAAELAVPGNKLRPPRRASKGHRLTEQNLKIWLQLNPKEAHARLMTIDSYVKQQGELLRTEAEARAKAQQESQLVDARMRDTYSQLRQSAYIDEDIASGVPIQPPRSSMYGGLPSSGKEDYKHKRDMTLLENGMIMERVDVKREEKEREKERKKEEKKMRKMSQMTDISSITPGTYGPPMTPTPSGMDLESNGGFEMTYPNMSSPSLQTSRPKSAPLGAPLGKYGSPASVDGRGARFLGSRHWQAPWSSGASMAPSGSMMDMHLALDQEHERDMKQFGMADPMNQAYATSSFSLPASPRRAARPHTADALMHPRRATSPDPKAKKSSGLVKLWKKVRSKKSDGKHQERSITSSLPPEDDMSMPLPPPPPMPYLHQHPQAPHQRQVSSPPNGAISPTTAPSSLLPSPTSNRFPWRESSGDDRRPSTTRDPNGDGTDTLQGFPSSDNNTPQQHQQYGGEANGMRVLVTGGSTSSEYGRMLQPSNGMPASATRSPAPSTLVSSSAHSPRPLSSVHKPLPPPPPSDGGSIRPVSASPASPNGMFGVRPNTIIVGEEMFAPPAPFREEGYDNRRQSFSGSMSRPDMLPPGAAHGLQTQRSIPAMQYMDQNSPYQEFGNAYDGYGNSPYLSGAMSDGGKSKRRSRFLPSFLGKKDKDKTPAPNFAPQMQQQQQQHQYQPNGDMRYSTIQGSPSPLMAPVRPPFGHSGRSRSSASLTNPDFAPGMNGTSHLSQPSFGFTEGGRPMSGVSTFTVGGRPPKQLIDEVVQRDQDFLAYRYPSAEQTLDISRR